MASIWLRNPIHPEGKITSMAAANSKAMFAIVLALLIASCSLPTPVDAGNKPWCIFKCIFNSASVAVFESCKYRCLHPSVSTTPIHDYDEE
ncbi:hypothetical protein SAY86_007690 [Trapa natans]|uniref:Uncharacterized protein n=1 Tax=Trapa natans TaxID=22666 RepID=A0AAN7R0Y1_TRANT|nr:hypothetical protein SAY86_007690 [Trapa natans]